MYRRTRRRARLLGRLARVRTAALRRLAQVVLRTPPLAGWTLRIIATWGLPEQRGRVAALLFDPLVREWFGRFYWPEPDPARREELKACAMGGEAGRRWAEEYAAAPLVTEAPLFVEVAEALERLGERSVLVQLGSSSGRELAWFARHFPEVRCIGVDLFPEVIEFATAAQREPNLSFRCLPVEEIGSLLVGLDGAPVVFSSGSLQYVQPEYLPGVFAALAGAAGLEAIVSESVLAPGEDPCGLERSLPRANFAWTHPYRRVAEACGFSTVRCDVDYPLRGDSLAWRAATGDLLWHGRAL